MGANCRCAGIANILLTALPCQIITPVSTGASHSRLDEGPPYAVWQ